MRRDRLELDLHEILFHFKLVDLLGEVLVEVTRGAPTPEPTGAPSAAPTAATSPVAVATVTFAYELTVEGEVAAAMAAARAAVGYTDGARSGMLDPGGGRSVCIRKCLRARSRLYKIRRAYSGVLLLLKGFFPFGSHGDKNGHWPCPVSRAFMRMKALLRSGVDIFSCVIF